MRLRENQRTLAANVSLDVQRFNTLFFNWLQRFQRVHLCEGIYALVLGENWNNVEFP